MGVKKKNHVGGASAVGRPIRANPPVAVGGATPHFIGADAARRTEFFRSFAQRVLPESEADARAIISGWVAQTYAASHQLAARTTLRAGSGSAPAISSPDATNARGHRDA